MDDLLSFGSTMFNFLLTAESLACLLLNPFFGITLVGLAPLALDIGFNWIEFGLILRIF